MVWCLLPFTLFLFLFFSLFLLVSFWFGAVVFGSYVKCPLKVWYKEWPIRFRQEISSRRYQSKSKFTVTPINIGEANYTKSRVWDTPYIGRRKKLS